MDLIQERIDWHNAEAMLPKPHVHKYLPKAVFDLDGDDVYRWGECECGAKDS